MSVDGRPYIFYIFNAFQCIEENAGVTVCITIHERIQCNGQGARMQCNAMHRIGVYLAMQYTGCEVTMQCTGWDNTRNQPPLANPPPLLLLRGQTWTTAVIQKILRNADLFRTHQYWHRNLLFLHHLDDAVGENCILQQGHLRMLRVAKCHGYGGYVPVKKLTKSRKMGNLFQIKLTSWKNEGF